MYTKEQIDRLNETLVDNFPLISPIRDTDKKTHSGISRMVMLDRYAQSDKSLKTLAVGDIVLTVIKEDPKYPAKGIGIVKKINGDKISVLIDEEFWGNMAPSKVPGVAIVSRSRIQKPLELYWEQIARRVGFALSKGEINADLQEKYKLEFSNELAELNIIPAGRVLYGAGSGTEVTYFNCFVMPFIKDSRGGISEHRKEVMEIMSRGGGVGTNGSTLRPKHSVAKGVGGKSSGAVSWLNDLAHLTNLVEQGGSRRGAQMIMLGDWHPDVMEFIISKMQNPKILKWLRDNSEDEEIRKLAEGKLKFVPISSDEKLLCEAIIGKEEAFDAQTVTIARNKLLDGGVYEVVDPNFLTGANISINITKEFMEAVENDTTYDLRFPDLDNMTKKEKEIYDNRWHEMGDVREWAEVGPVKVYRTIRARALWDLINFCATYSAEPGVFFIDNANKMTNAKAYGQKVVATNPCGEQPLAPYSVCNLAAVNLANFVNKGTKELLLDKLAQSVKTCVRMQDNVIDMTPYFLEANKNQAINERRLGLGIMGLHDLLIWHGVRYGSKEGNDAVRKVFQTISRAAYEASVELAKEKGSFGFLDDKEAFINTGYMKKMPQDIRDSIMEHGIRNSHLLTIAPTGSTGTMVGVSTGLEPYFAFKYYRSGRLGKFIEVNSPIVEEWLKYNPEYSADNLPNIFASAMDLTPEEHVDVQCIIQEYVDSSISKTINAPRGYSVKQVEQAYERLYKGGAKGGTVYVDGSRESQVLSLTSDDNEFSSGAQASLDGLEVENVPVSERQHEEIETSKPTGLRGDKLDREIGIEVGNLCPICNEGTVEEIGGCNTCTNCNAQLKCGL